MKATEFDLRGKDDPLTRENPNTARIGDSLPVEHHAEILQRRAAELLAAVQEGGVNAEILEPLTHECREV